MVELLPYQKEAVEKLDSGSVLCGGVGSGKSLTSLFYYANKESSKPLYIITTARKRDTLEWESECSKLFLIPVKVDSWNNIGKYIDVEDSFFIFDEQRIVGSGLWVKSFLKISKKNRWILLSATPGDVWMDYVPVFIANGFYKNRTEFIRRHVVYNTYTKYPKIDRYVETARLERLRRDILVTMDYSSITSKSVKYITCLYDKNLYLKIIKDRWNPYSEEPIKDASEFCSCLRKVVNSDPSRLNELHILYLIHKKIIVFYNFDYELENLRKFAEFNRIPYSEWNGHNHDIIVGGDNWLYFVQYTAGAEGWNCIETDTIVFYSLNYSYKIMHQASGRIDRLNTPFTKLYYFCLISSSSIDASIFKSIGSKKSFNEQIFLTRGFYKDSNGEEE